MGLVRGIVGATLGTAAAAVALRVRTVAKEREQSTAEVLQELPDLLAEDASRVAGAARNAVADGREASRRARIDFDVQVAARARRTKGHDG